MKFTDNYSDEYRRQEVSSDNPDVDVWFCAEDLSEEEAKIGAYLFDARDYIEALRIGMRIAALGYTDIVVEEEEWID